MLRYAVKHLYVLLTMIDQVSDFQNDIVSSLRGNKPYVHEIKMLRYYSAI